MIVLGSLHSAARRAKMRRGRENRAAPVGMTTFESEEMVRVGHGSAPPLGDGLGDDADVGEAGDAQRIDDSSEAAKGNGFVATEENGVLGMLELLANFVGELVDVDGIVAEVNALSFVDGDDEALLGDFLDGVSFREVDLDAGLQDGRGDHEDDQEDEDDVNERHHVDVGEARLRGFSELRHVR
jgi:hypothetical protein